MKLRPRKMPLKKKIKKGPRPDSVKAHPEVARNLAEMVQRDEIDVKTTFNEVWIKNPEFHVVAKEKFRQYFNTIKKNITDLAQYPSENGMFYILVLLKILLTA